MTHNRCAEDFDDDGCPLSDPDCMGNNGDRHDACVPLVAGGQGRSNESTHDDGRWLAVVVLLAAVFAVGVIVGACFGGAS